VPQSKQTEPAAANRPATAPDGPADLETVRRAWPRVIQRLNSERSTRSLCAILKDGQPAAFENGTLTIGFPGSHTFHATRAQANADKVEEAIKYVAGIDVKIKTDAGTPAAEASAEPGSSRARSKSPSQASAARKAAETPTSDLVEEVINTFGGEVLDDQDPFS